MGSPSLLRRLIQAPAMCPDLPCKLEDAVMFPVPGYQAGVWQGYVEDKGAQGPWRGAGSHAMLPLGRELGQSKEADQESSHLFRMGRNSVLKRQETKGYLTQLPPLLCAHSSVTLSSRTGNVCCHCARGVPASRDKRQGQELPGKAAPAHSKLRPDPWLFAQAQHMLDL